MKKLPELIFIGLFSPIIAWPLEKQLVLLEIKESTFSWTEYFLLHYSLAGVLILIYFVHRMLKNAGMHEGDPGKR